MEIITMEMEAYKSLIKKIDRVYDEIKILQNPAAEREGFEPNAPICSISVIYKNSFR
jgi:hypothetical protein